MPLTPVETAALIDHYAAGPEVLLAALTDVPADAMRWRPADEEWSVHEIVVHCADSETASAHRIRVLVAEPDPLIVGYDQAAWARLLDYHARPLDEALSAVAAARSSTAEFVRSLPPDAWTRSGRHSESGDYTAEDWLRIYAAHLHDHADQIAANVAAWLNHSLG